MRDGDGLADGYDICYNQPCTFAPAAKPSDVQPSLWRARIYPGLLFFSARPAKNKGYAPTHDCSAGLLLVAAPTTQTETAEPLTGLASFLLAKGIISLSRIRANVLCPTAKVYIVGRLYIHLRLEINHRHDRR